jgi:hypothetical protein
MASFSNCVFRGGCVEIHIHSNDVRDGAPATKVSEIPFHPFKTLSHCYTYYHSSNLLQKLHVYYHPSNLLQKQKED